MTEWEAVIGLETHVELQTNSKMFCGCPVDFGDEPNTAVCPVCLAMPGALPVPNEQAIEGILSIGEALDCTLTERSLFYRKNYFYPDLPKNYQISQYTFPLCVDGRLDVDVDGEPTTVGITRVHMEEDTGKSTHERWVCRTPASRRVRCGLTPTSRSAPSVPTSSARAPR